MALRYRKRTKGKNGWMNFSWSEKNGLNASVSVKAGPFTWNSGNGKSTRRRITTNIGGGFHHVSYDERSSKPKTSTPKSSYSTGSTHNDGPEWGWNFFVIAMAVMLLVTWPVVGCILLVVAATLWYISKKEDPERLEDKLLSETNTAELKEYFESLDPEGQTDLTNLMEIIREDEQCVSRIFKESGMSDEDIALIIKQMKDLDASLRFSK